MRNWEELLPDVLHLICKRVDYFKDLVAFGGVCPTWRHVAVKQNMSKPLVPFPWLMLAEHEHDDVRDFYSVTEGKIYSYDLPELRGKKCMETKGWIVTSSDKGEMALVHPLTRVKISLPHQNTSECYEEYPMDPLTFVRHAVLSSAPKPKNERDSVLMIIHGGMGDIGFCRLGDKVWTVVKKMFKSANDSLEYFRGKFYVATYAGEVWECDMIEKSNDTDLVSLRRIRVNFHTYMRGAHSYLVQSAGSLLVVIRDGVYKNEASSEFSVFEIMLEHGRLKPLNNLGSSAIFLGHSANLSVDTNLYPELIPNSIYFTDDCSERYRCDPEGGGTNMGVYNLGNKSVQPHYSGKSLSLVCAPVWTFLTSR